MRGVAAAIALALAVQAHATTIVALWTPSRLVISGDSLVNSYWTGESGERRHTTSNNCKIRKFGAHYISAAGNYHIQTAGFDVWEIAARSCGQSVSFETCSSLMKTELRGALARAAGVHQVALSVIVAGMQNGAPALDHFTMIGSVNGHLSVKTESFRKGRQQAGRVILGDREAIDRFEKGTARSTTSLQEQASSLVRIEERAMPQDVGGGITTLTIDSAGERWTNPGCCPMACSAK